MSARGSSSSPATVASSAASVCADVGARVALAPAEGVGAPALGRLTTYGASPAKGAPTGALANSTPPSGDDDGGPSRGRRARLWRLRDSARKLSSRASVRMCGVVGATVAQPGMSPVLRATYLTDDTYGWGLNRRERDYAVHGLDWQRNTATTPSVTFRRSSETGKSRVAGLHACGSVHECPTCRDRITGERAREIQTAVNAHRDRGGTVVMVTLTVRHRWGSHDALMREVPRVFTAMRKDRRWREWWQANELGRIELRTRTHRRKLPADTTFATYGELAPGVELEELGDGRLCEVRAVEYRHVTMDYVRAAEVTHGSHGWHPHLHVLVFLERAPDTLRAFGRLRGELSRMWGDAVARELGESHRPSLRRGAHVKVCNGEVGDYLSKLGLEVASDLEKDRSSGASPLQLLEAAREGDVESASLWRRYARAMVGMRQLTWSRKTRQALALPREREDIELAIERADATDEDVLEVPADTWKRVFARRTELVVHILNGIREASSRESARQWAWLVLRRELGDDIVRELRHDEARARALRRRHERASLEPTPREHRELAGLERRGVWAGYAFDRALRYDQRWKGGKR